MELAPGHDGAATTPMLLPVLAAHMKRCMDLLRDSGLRADGQINKRLLRKTVLSLGLQARHHDVDHLFEYLDPEATGCVDFADMANALREAKKQLWSPRSGGHASSMPTRHENGEPIQEADY
eukprot:5391660-Prymnesium_polylepis.1